MKHGIILFLVLNLLGQSVFAQIPGRTPSRDAQAVQLQGQVDRTLLSLRGVGNFTYKHRWYWDEGAKLPPCVPSSPSYLEAQRRLSTADAMVTSTASGAPLEPLRTRLSTLAAHPCLATAADLPYFSSVDSLQDYWFEGGYLALTTALNVNRTHSYVIPADHRPSLLEFVAENPRLARFVCKSPASCSRESRWKADLQAELHLARLQGALKRLKGPSADWEASEERCALAATTAPKDLQFVHWRNCAERTSPAEVLLPRGNFRTAKAGWLFLHVETRNGTGSGYLAVNLATGGALRIPHGFICSPSTDDESQSGIFGCASGYGAAVRLQLNVKDTQRLLWQLLMQTRTTTGRPHSTSLQIPRGVAATGVVLSPMGHCAGAGGPDTTLGWALADRSGKLIASGVNYSWSSPLLGRTRLLYEGLLTNAPPSEALRNGQSQWWPKTSKLLRKPWEKFTDPLLFQTLIRIEGPP